MVVDLTSKNEWFLFHIGTTYRSVSERYTREHSYEILERLQDYLMRNKLEPNVRLNLHHISKFILDNTHFVVSKVSNMADAETRMQLRYPHLFKRVSTDHRKGEVYFMIFKNDPKFYNSKEPLPFEDPTTPDKEFAHDDEEDEECVNKKKYHQ